MSIITYLTTIRLAEGAVADLPQDMKDLGLKRPLIVSDRGLVAAGMVERLKAAAPVLADARLFADVPTNPTEEATLAALDLYRAQGCDGVIALGGGSPMDLAKGVALLATHEGPMAQYMLVLGGLARITPAVAPVICIPTTAGTGSEVGRGALITLVDGRKMALISPHLIPKRAICDPELTYGLPPVLTAATGMDALTHCIETFISPRDNPTAEAIALDGLGRAMRHIERATQDGSDKTARREMVIAALHGGLTFQKGLGAVHALSHPLGSLKELALHHGMLNAVLLPHVLAFNAGHVGEKYDVLRRVMGLAPGADLPQAIHDLVGRLKLPQTLSAMNVPRQVFDPIAVGAVADHSAPTNPRPASEADYRALLDAAFA
jgi:4-hydroxybutyrate dehydrogenase